MDQDAVNKKNVKLIIIVAALGYFVDIYDLILFSVIRIKSLKGLGVSEGDLLERFKKYLSCILIGIPLWFVVGVLVTFSPEFGKELNATEPLSAGTGIMYCYIGIAIGDIVAGFLSQMWRSRKKVMLVFLLLTGVSIVVYLNAEGMNSQQFIWLVLFLGFSSGYWATFVTIASEQFGTNLRATVTTTVPNFVRGSLVLATLSFTALKGSLGIINSALVVGFVSLVIALIALYQLKETFGKDLDYLEIS
jgi:MFS family permease